MQSVLPDQILLIENTCESKNFSRQWLESFFKHKVSCVYRQIKTPNVAASRNTSLKLTSQDIFISIDDDGRFNHPHAIRDILALHQQYKNVTAFVGPIYPMNPSRISLFSAALYTGGLQYSNKRVLYIPTYPMTHYSLKIHDVRSKDVSFDQSLDTGEDIDFFWRMTRRGMKLGFHRKHQASALFPHTIIQFIQKQYSYAKNYGVLYEKTDGCHDGISWLFPQRKLHVMFYPLYLMTQIIRESAAELRYIKLPGSYMVLALLHQWISAVGIIRSSQGKRFIINRFHDRLFINQ